MSATLPTSNASATPDDPAKDVLQLLMDEHREVKAMFLRYQALATAAAVGEGLVAQEHCLDLAVLVHQQLQDILGRIVRCRRGVRGGQGG